MTTLLAIIAFALQPADEAVVERVDLIEVNAFYDEAGKVVFDQVIFYDWDNEAGRYQVVAWRMLKKADQYPRRNWGEGGYVTVWYDGDVLRKVKSHALSETFTQYDPELIERDYLPKDQRRELKTRREIKTGPLRINAAGYMIPR